MAATIFDANAKTNQTLSGGNLVATSTGAGAALVTRRVTGKHYFEATLTTLAGTPSVGFEVPSYLTSAVQGAAATSLAYRPSGIVVVNAVTLSTIQTYTGGDRIGVAIDPLLQQVWFRVNNGNWNNNVANNPATGVGGIDYSSMALNSLIAGVYASITGTVWTCKFSTAFTDTAPAGFASLDTVQTTVGQTNVNEPGLPVSAPSFTAIARTSETQRGVRSFSPAGAITTVNGVVSESGVAVSGKKVWLYDRSTGDLIGCTTSAVDGTWSMSCLGRPKVLVVCNDPTTYNSIVYDNVTPG
jgi:hypothetical protein